VQKVVIELKVLWKRLEKTVEERGRKAWKEKIFDRVEPVDPRQIRG
jgi:hypothetical protein